MPDDIIVRLNGGLGNQLFQYAAGLGAAKRLGCNLKLDVSRLENPSHGVTPRQFELGFLTKVPNILRLPEPPALFKSSFSIRNSRISSSISATRARSRRLNAFSGSGFLPSTDSPSYPECPR
mgnify:CR=1 FL=1